MSKCEENHGFKMYLETSEHLCLAQFIDPSLAEGQSAKILVDGAQKCLGTRQTQWHVRRTKVLHIVTLQKRHIKSQLCDSRMHSHWVPALAFLIDIPASGRPKRLNGI